MTRTLALLAVAACAVPEARAADTWSIDKGHSEVLFQVRHLVSRVTGRFTDFAGTITGTAESAKASSVEFSIQAASIDTNLERRDGHLRSNDFLAAEKHPQITFRSTRIEPKGGDAFDVHGVFTMRGVSKEITLPVNYLGQAADPWGNTRAGFEASLTLNRKDYGVLWNKALDQGGFLLGDEVKVMIHIEAVLQKPAADAPAGG